MDSVPSENKNPSPIVLLALILDNYIRGGPPLREDVDILSQSFRTTRTLHGMFMRGVHHVTYPFAFLCILFYNVIRYSRKNPAPHYTGGDGSRTSSDEDPAPHLVSGDR